MGIKPITTPVGGICSVNVAPRKARPICQFTSGGMRGVPQFSDIDWLSRENTEYFYGNRTRRFLEAAEAIRVIIAAH